MKKIIIAAVLLFMIVPSDISARKKEQASPGALTPEILSTISKSYEGTPSDKALKNALAGTSIAVLALNSDNASPVDTHFSDKVKSKGITNQRSSGRCWLFTGLNVLRARMIDKFDLPEFQFSQNYLFFYDQLEKANLFLQGVIDTRSLPFDDRKVDWLFSNPIGDGGQFTGVSNLIAKYGLVPSDAMPETYSSNSTSQMSSLIRTKLREDGLRLREAEEKDLSGMKIDMLGDIYRILALCLGVPPAEFEWTRCNSKGEVVSKETYTPMSFYRTYVGEDLENGYVMVMNDPCREYGKVYEIDYDRHVYEGQNWVYVNLPVERIKEMAIASIKDNTALYFSCDVGKFLIREKGLMDINNFDYSSLMGVDFGMDKKERVMTHASGSSHAMTLMAVDLKDGKPVKWMVENSWGKDSGQNGYYIMTDEWFDEYMFRLVVSRKYVPQDVLDMLNQKAELLPSWDPMFMEED